MLSRHARQAVPFARDECGVGRGSRSALLAAGALLLSVAVCAKGAPVADSSSSTTKGESSTGAGVMKGMSGMGRMKGMSGSDTGAIPGMAGRSGDSRSMAAMKGMEGMADMMGTMQKHMEAMRKVSPDQLKAMMPAHRQMAGNMLAGMTADMRQMNMSADAAWTATIDSVRQDLIAMPELTGREIAAAMPAHEGRMMRLMGMHTTMMRIQM